MKLFGNSSKPQGLKTAQTGTIPQMALPEDEAKFDLSGKDFETRLNMLLDGEELSSPKQLQAEPPKEMGKPINTDYHITQDPIRGTKVRFDDEDDEDEESASMSGWLKGTLLLIASMIVFVLVVFGVYINLT